MSDGDEITPEELNELLEDDAEVRIVDIRSSAQFERGSIPGSENIPFQSLSQEIESLGGDQRIVTVCPHGKASLQAMQLIRSYEGTEGTVQSLEGGLDAWSRDYGLDAGDEESETEADADAPF